MINEQEHHFLGRREMTATFNGPLPDELTGHMEVIHIGEMRFDDETMEVVASNSGSTVQECLALFESLPDELKPVTVHVTREILTVYTNMSSGEGVHREGCGDGSCKECYGEDDDDSMDFLDYMWYYDYDPYYDEED